VIREHSFPDETYQVGIDFDGVIHKNSKGFYDGTVYDEPVEGVYDALKKLSEKYQIIIFSAKARKDRMLINNKTGDELIWDWLKKYKLDCFVTSVTSEKPRAVFYVDDKSFRFESWKNCMKDLMSHEFI
tara:strand:+ start:741 stop:1127 length:387 start_codon:yes stop_codon:yes gene_type:complete